LNQWILADSKEFKEFMKDIGALNVDLNQKNVMSLEDFQESKKILKVGGFYIWNLGFELVQ
jgi:hypothetical protein